ncbi:MAG: PilZ domain-containing protein [Treponemataceae bacterium]|nr:MAG: PilZ domain-containing protein [Treponemataceae bacterium]
MCYTVLMGVLTSQQITRYYETFRDTDVIFSQNLIKTLRLDTREVYLKYAGGQWPCVIHSVSFTQAKVVIGSTSPVYSQLVETRGNISLRFYFQQIKAPMTFFVNGKVEDTQVIGEKNLAMVSIIFSTRPPDDLIEFLGQYTEAGINFEAHKNTAFPVTPDIRRRMGIIKDDSVLTCGGKVYHCMLHEMTFVSAKVIVRGTKETFDGNAVSLFLDFDDVAEAVEVHAGVIGVSDVQGKPDIFVLSLAFAEDKIPMIFKIHFNSYLVTTPALKALQLADAPAHANAPEAANPAAPNVSLAATADADASAAEAGTPAAESAPAVENAPAAEGAPEK